MSGSWTIWEHVSLKFQCMFSTDKNIFTLTPVQLLKYQNQEINIGVILIDSLYSNFNNYHTDAFRNKRKNSSFGPGSRLGSFTSRIRIACQSPFIWDSSSTFVFWDTDISEDYRSFILENDPGPELFVIRFRLCLFRQPRHRSLRGHRMSVCPTDLSSWKYPFFPP